MSSNTAVVTSPSPPAQGELHTQGREPVLPVKRLKAGGTCYEPAGSLYRVSRNPGRKGRTRLQAMVLHASHITIPGPPHQK